MGPVGHGAGTTGQIPLEHTADGVGAAVDQLGDLGSAMALGVQQDHLVAGTGLGVAGGLVAAIQLVVGGPVQRHAQRRRHDRPPCDQET
jgi:hypothetical protein